MHRSTTLSQRERRILLLLQQGTSNSTIALALKLTDGELDAAIRELVRKIAAGP